MRVAVGVDAGGTATAAASSRDGEYWRSERGGPGNAVAVGFDSAVETMIDTITRAADGLAPAAIYVGAAGAGQPAVAERLERDLRGAFSATAHLTVVADVETALRAAIPAGPGIVLIAGTGSVAYAENGARRVLVGGYGYLAGDEGSAFAIGFAAVKLLSRVYDGRARADETTALVERVLGCNDRAGLLAALYAVPLDVVKFASLAPSIVAFAGKGNRAASAIVENASAALGALITSAANQSGLSDSSPVVAFAGGLLREDSVLSSSLEARVRNDVSGATIVRLREKPVRAALRFAEAMLGIAIPIRPEGSQSDE